jgi:FkbM family methyltransferase
VAARLISLKLATPVPEITWNDIVRNLTGLERSPHFASEQVTGRVILKRRSTNNACPYVYSTPVGDIHARFQDGELLEGMLDEIVRGKVYEHEVTRVHTGDVVLDVGSHLGGFALYAFQNGASRVVAFEPDPGNLACLKQTFSREIRDGKYLLVEAAVSGSPGRISLLQHPNSSMSRTVEQGDQAALKDWEKKVFKPWQAFTPQERTVEVQAVTIDDTLARERLDKVDFVKMDIEGAERYALAGAQGLLRRLRPRMVLCTYHRPDDAAVLPDMVLKAQPAYRVFATKNQAYFF